MVKNIGKSSNILVSLFLLFLALFLLPIGLSTSEAIAVEEKENTNTIPRTLKIQNDTYDIAPTPFIKEEKLYFPVRSIFEKMELEGNWKDEEKLVKANRNDLSIKIEKNIQQAIINSREVNLSGELLTRDKRSYIPYDFFHELYKDVDWDEENKHVKFIPREVFEVREDGKEGLIDQKGNVLLVRNQIR